MLKDPVLYSVGIDYLEDDPSLVQKRADIVHTAAAMLEKCHLIKYERVSGRFQSTELGRIASYYYVTYNSMAVYNQHLRSTMSMIELFRVFALSNEFKLIPVRQDVSCIPSSSARVLTNIISGKTRTGQAARASPHSGEGERRRARGEDQRPASSLHLATQARRLRVGRRYGVYPAVGWTVSYPLRYGVNDIDTIPCV